MAELAGTDVFRALYEENSARLHRLLARMVGREDAEDVAQVVFAKAARALPGFRGAAQPSTWLYRIATNVASDWLHSRATQEAKLTDPLPDARHAEHGASPPIAADLDSPPSPEEEVARKDTRACIRGEIAKLPETHRAVLMLSMLGGLSDEEIAATLGISHGNAKVRLHRARQEFRTIIAARCDFYRNELSCKPTSPDCCAPATPAEKA